VKEKGAPPVVPPELDVSVAAMGGGPAVLDLGEFMQRMMPGGGGGGRGGKAAVQRRTVKVREARGLLAEAEVDKRLAGVDLRREAVHLAEQNGIVVIDEIDKIVSNKSRNSGDASSEGVQRDLLPLIEGTTIEVRRFGNVRTDYMLFIACGAFHEHKPSDLLAELQGRLPIRVELRGLDAADLERILTEPRYNLIAQQRALLRAEGVDLEFEPAAITEIARLAAAINREVENIGARRLHTVIERIMEDISFRADEVAGSGGRVVVDAALVRTKLAPMLEKTDLSRFIL
jgi:ATP-dependent HslUV protease ATP-binding subunit HslU